MIAMARHGYRANAFDYRGYGLSDQLAEPEKATLKDLLDDVVGLLDSLDINKAFLVGKDFGARPTFLVSALHSERVSGLVTIGVLYTPQRPYVIQNLLPKGLYISGWQEPGRADADFARFDVKTVVRNIYTLLSRSELPIANDDQEIMDLFDPSTPLPPWFSEQDLLVYASLYENSGFRFALQVPYRSFDEIDEIDLTIFSHSIHGRSLSVDIGVADPKVTAPALPIMGDKDYSIKFPGIEGYIRSGAVKKFVPDLNIAFLAGGSHFVHEQLPEQVNRLIVNFLDKHSIGL